MTSSVATRSSSILSRIRSLTDRKTAKRSSSEPSTREGSSKGPLDPPGGSSWCTLWEALQRSLGGGRRVRIGEEQRDQGYLNHLVDVANDHVHRSHDEKEHDR